MAFLGTDPGRSRAAAFGSQIDTGIGRGLQNILNQKIDKLEEAAAVKKFRSAGFSRQDAQLLAMQRNNPAVLGKLLPQYGSFSGQEGDEEDQNALAQLNPNIQQQEQDMGLLNQIQAQQQPSGMMDVQQAYEMLSNPMSFAQQRMGQVPQGMQRQPQMPGQGMQRPQPQQSIQGQIGQQLPQQIQQQPQQKYRQRIANQAETEKQIEDRYKFTQETRKEILSKGAQAKNDLEDLDRLEELEKEGKLDTPGYVEFLKRSGLDIPALMNEGSEEFQKIAQNFMRNASTYFGGRVSNYEIEQFLKTIPSLSQSPEGRKRVIANLKRLKRGEVAYRDAYKEVLAENRGVLPRDYLEKIDDKLDRKLNMIAKQFRNDISKPSPKGQNRLITALQAGLGNVAGSLPTALKGAAKGGIAGAALGSAFPGIGTVAGTLGGAAFGALGGSAADLL